MTQIAIVAGKAPKYRLEIQDTIRDFNERPHRMIKMVVSGENFPIRDAPLFVRIRNGNKTEDSWLVELSEDADQIIACFPLDIILRGNVEFGYADEVFGIFKNPKWENFHMLDSKLIDNDVVVVNKKWIKKELAKPKK